MTLASDIVVNVVNCARMSLPLMNFKQIKLTMKNQKYYPVATFPREKNYIFILFSLEFTPKTETLSIPNTLQSNCFPEFVKFSVRGN